MLIQVTQDHINRGQKRCSNNCPVSLAIKEKTNQICYVGWWSISIYEGCYCAYNIRCPHSIAKFIQDFDFGEPVVPFEFELEIKDGKAKIST